ncbi:MAG: nuclease-related domain-containing protein [Pseudomonadota bacterium]
MRSQDFDNIALLIGLAILGIALMYLVSAAIAWLQRRRGTADERQIEKLIKKHNLAYLKKATLSDGVDGYIFADYLIQLPREIITLNVLLHPGNIFGGDKLHLWTQVHHGRSTTFQNPLIQAKAFAQRCTQLIDGMPVSAYVLFGRQSRFPKGVPQGVLFLETFKSNLESFDKAAPTDPACEKAWRQLVEIAAEHQQALRSEASLSRPL